MGPSRHLLKLGIIAMLLDNNMDEGIAQQIDPAAGQEHVPYPRSVIAGVFILLLLVSGLSVWQMKNRLSVSLPQLGSGKTVKELTTSLLAAQDEQLKQQDSDQDGLTDYQEMKVYGTSPFFADSDSDKATDAAEVAAGTDPNCPAGQQCGVGTQSLADSRSSTNPFFSEEFKAVLNNPAQLRVLLIQGGADPKVINSLDDQTIQVLAQEAYTAATTATPEKIELLKQVDPEQIREILKAAGFAADQLAEFSDEQLMEIYNQVLIQVSAEQ